MGPRVRPFGSLLQLLLLSFASATLGCGIREPVPAFTANDARFGRLAGKGDPPSLQRMFLHAWSLKFNHPKLRKVVHLQAELPPELKQFLPSSIDIAATIAP